MIFPNNNFWKNRKILTCSETFYKNEPQETDIVYIMLRLSIILNKTFITYTQDFLNKIFLGPLLANIT